MKIEEVDDDFEMLHNIVYELYKRVVCTLGYMMNMEDVEIR